MSIFKDITNHKFGRWTAISPVHTGKGANWLCVCDCGNTSAVAGKSLRNGTSKSCGCLKNESAAERMKISSKTHGKSKTRTYGIWNTMVMRCTNQNSISYKNYGAKGISVCESWRTFENFLKDMGEAPHGYSIDRLDNSKDYSLDNCQWIPRSDQARNKSNNCLITANGKTMLLADWSRELGIGISTLWYRYNAGWTHSEIVGKPIRTAKQ